MAKAKKMLSAVLAALMVVLSVASYVPAQAAKAVNVPKLQMVTQPEKEYKNGDRVSFTVTSPNYGGQVEYRVILWNGTTKKQSELWPTHKGYYYQNWKPAGSYKFTIHWPVEGMEPGAYSLTVLTRRANAKVPYDSFVKTEAFWVKNELAVDSIAALEDVTVDQGAEAKLPAEVTLNMTDKTTKTAKVTWEAVDTAKPGEYTVNGTVEGTDKKATVKVIVKEAVLKVESVSAITAKSFEVKFNKAVADADKVTFAVQRGTVATTITTTWNEEKTIATLAASAKLPEAVYTITVKAGDEELLKKDVEITKEVVKTVEYSSEQILRMNNVSGVLGVKVLNQYGENVTNLALGRGLIFSASTDGGNPGTYNGGCSVDYKAGTVTVTHGKEGTYLNQLKDLPSVVITVRDTTTGFVQTNSFTVSQSVGVVNDVKLTGIVDENGKDVDLRYDLAKTYYLKYEALDLLGKQTTNYAALNADLYNQKVLDVKSTNPSIIEVKAERHPNDSTKMVYRLNFVGTNPPAYDTPITFIAVAPFSGKNSNYTTTIYRKTAVETFRLLNPSETVSVNKSVEIPFEAFDQNGKAVTNYDDLNGKITFSLDKNIINFVKQPDGSAKLFAKFPLKQIYYITSTVLGSMKGSFSQIAIDVKEIAAATTISPLLHKMAYTTGSSWSVDVRKFTVKDQFDRTIALRTDANAKNYGIRIKTDRPDVVSVTVAGSTDNVISGGTKVKFAGGTTVGTATITYELIDIVTNKVLDTTSAIAYNIPIKDIRSVELDASTDPIYMLRGDSAFYNGGAISTIAGDAYASENYITLVGKTDSGMSVRLPSGSAWYTSSDARFSGMPDVIADGDFGNEATAKTTVTGHFTGVDGVYSASAEVTATNVRPVVDSVYTDYDLDALRNGTITVTNDVVDVTAADFGNLFVGKSIYSFDTNGAAPAENSAGYFGATTQYGEYVLNRVVVIKTVGSGSISVDNKTGIITGSVVSGDEYTITGIAVNGRTAVMRIRIK